MGHLWGMMRSRTGQSRQYEQLHEIHYHFVRGLFNILNVRLCRGILFYFLGQEPMCCILCVTHCERKLTGTLIDRSMIAQGDFRDILHVTLKLHYNNVGIPHTHLHTHTTTHTLLAGTTQAVVRTHTHQQNRRKCPWHFIWKVLISCKVVC